MAVVVGTIPFGFLEGVVPAPVFGFDFVELSRGSLLVPVMDFDGVGIAEIALKFVHRSVVLAYLGYPDGPSILTG